MEFRPLEDLTLMDDYMFGTVMQEERLAKPLIERILGITIRSIQYIEPQKSLKKGVNIRGVRLDLYVEDEKGSVYNVEVQTTRKRHLAKRMRYYQSTIDTHVLQPGVDYLQLKDSYIIFICNHDPFAMGRYLYRFENRCVDEPELALNDGAVKVILNTDGENGDIDEGLFEIIKYLHDGSVIGDYSHELDDAVENVKQSEERRHEYHMMMLREQEIRNECLAQGMAQGMAQGTEKAHIESIRNLMDSMNLTAKQAMTLLKIPEDKQKVYLEKIQALQA